MNYYHTIKVENGAIMADDTVASKIVNVPIDKTDVKMLYHLTSMQNVMYGPSDQFDVLTKAIQGQTVRLTGYTVDKLWVRIMLDDGQTGFIKSKYLKKGVGNDIPAKSQIVYEK